MNREKITEQTAAIIAAEQAMDARADAKIYEPVSQDQGKHAHTHMAIAWRGGVIWLDMSEQADHFCIDVRQFVALPDPEDGLEWEHKVNLAGQGIFTIVNGVQQSLGRVFHAGQTYEEWPLQDPDGTPVKGHGWNAGYVVTLMHDKEPGPNQTNRPAGMGRG